MPQCHSGSLAAMYCPDMKIPAVKKTPSWLQNLDEVSVPPHPYKPVPQLSWATQEVSPLLPWSEESEPQMHVVYSVSSCLSRGGQQTVG